MEEDMVKGKAKRRRYSLMSLKCGEEYEPVSIPSLPDLKAYEPLPQGTSGRLRGSNRVSSLPSPGLPVSRGSAYLDSDIRKFLLPGPCGILVNLGPQQTDRTTKCGTFVGMEDKNNSPGPNGYDGVTLAVPSGCKKKIIQHSSNQVRTSIPLTNITPSRDPLGKRRRGDDDLGMKKGSFCKKPKFYE